MIAAGRLQPTGKGTVLLLAAVGAFIGVGGVLVAFVFFMLLCGVVMLGTVIRNLVTDVIGSPAAQTSEETDDVVSDGSSLTDPETISNNAAGGVQSLFRFTLPLSPAIAIAAVLTLLYERQTLSLLGLK